MRILFVSSNFGGSIVGGAQQSIRYVAERLIADGHRVAVLSVDDGIADDMDWKISGLSRYRIPVRNLYWRPRETPGKISKAVWHIVDRLAFQHRADICRVIDEFRPDVVHTNVLSGFGDSPWTAASSRGVPIVHSVHDFYLVCVTSGMRKSGANCVTQCTACSAVTKLTSTSTDLVSRVIYVSEFMRASHERAGVFSRTPFDIIHGSFRHDVDFQLKPLSDGLTFGFLGRLAPDKGVGRMLDSLQSDERLKGISKQWRVLIAGTGEDKYVEGLIEAARGLPVSFVGKVRASEFLRGIDVLIVPSLWHEPASRGVYEAGICGRPSIVTSRGGLPELVKNGSAGWIYEPDTLSALPDIVFRLVRHPTEVLERAEAWKEAREAFTVDSVTMQTLHSYERARQSSKGIGVAN